MRRSLNLNPSGVSGYLSSHMLKVSQVCQGLFWLLVWCLKHLAGYNKMQRHKAKLINQSDSSEFLGSMTFLDSFILRKCYFSLPSLATAVIHANSVTTLTKLQATVH